VHREFRAALDSARGGAEWIIAIFVDIREFSAFNERVESVQSGLFVKKAYQRILDDFFPYAAFFKPTGDGLMIIVSWDEDALAGVLASVVDSALRLVSDFGTLTKNDLAINFDVPNKVGIGIARGAACRLYSGEKTLDYSGRILNLGARLLDFARPEGIVLDGGYGLDALPEPIKSQFAKDSVYIRGIAPKRSWSIYYTKDFTVIQARDKKPLEQIEWAEVKDKFTVKSLLESENYRIHFPSIPSEPDLISVEINYPKPTEGGRRHKTLSTRQKTDEFEYVVDGTEAYIRFHARKVGEEIKQKRAGLNWPVGVRVRFPR
jgi:hypothetical protein